MPGVDELISENIRRFLLHCIPSVPHLEALLLLSGSYPTTEAWHATTVAARLYLPDRNAAEVLAELTENGLLECVDTEQRIYRYAPRDQDIALTVRQLADVYAKRLIEVTKMIHSTTGRKAQFFADAFRWRKN